MDTIRNYLENMFRTLPDTQEVRRAKDELWQMMEDKYTELIDQGLSENEAIGRVISEFGNLEEIAADLGIDGIVGERHDKPKKEIDRATVCEYRECFVKRAHLIAAGVMMCIISVCFPIICDSDLSHSDVAVAVGVCLMFMAVAVGVGFFVCAGSVSSRWKYIRREGYVLDNSAMDFVNQWIAEYRTRYELQLSIGIGLCIISVIPPIFADSVNYYSELLENAAAAGMFLLVGIGVFLIVDGSLNMSIYNRLLSLNKYGRYESEHDMYDAGYSGEGKHSDGKYVYDNKTLAAFMSTYWGTVTCVYLCVSFLTFDWGRTWIIWLIAVVVESLIKNLYGHK